MPEQPVGKDTEDQNKSITQQTQAPEQTRNTQQTQQTDLAQELLALLGIQNKQSGGDASSAGGFGETRARASARAGISEAGLAEVRFGDGSPRPSQSQQATTSAAASREVNCLPCGGCCGGRRRGRRLPGRVYDFVAWVAGVRGVPMCQVVNEYPELFCQGAGRGRGHGLGRVKELERLLSREGQYKGSYLVKRLGECSSDVVCAEYVRLGVEGWLRLWFYLNNRALGEGVVENYLGNIAKSLGFSGVVELVRYLRLVVQGLVVEYPTDRHAGYKDILEVGCGLCGKSFSTTVGLPAFIVKLVRHFQVKHGLGSVEDVKAKVEELMVKELNKKDRFRAHPVLRELKGEELVEAFVSVLIAVGFLVDNGDGKFRCVVDGAVFEFSDEAVFHVLRFHPNVGREVEHLLEVRGSAHGGEGSG